MAVAARWLSVLAATYATILTALYLRGAVPRHRPESGWFAAGALAILAVLLRGGLIAAIMSRPHAAEMSRPWRAWAALAGVSIAAYAGVIGTGLLSDDFVLLARAGERRLTMGNEFYRPLPFLIWSSGPWFGAAAAPVFHLTNVLLHGVNACLLMAVARAFSLPRMLQVVTAVLFVLHPVAVEPVTWISALPDVLTATGTLVMVLGTLAGSAVATSAGLAVALLSKESGVAAPVIALAACWAAGRSLRLPAMGLGVTAVFVMGRLAFLPLPDGYMEPPSKYLLKELVTRTFGTLAAPWGTGELAAFGWALTAATSAACLLVMLGGATSPASSRVRVLSAGTAWVLASVAPVYSYLFISEHMEGSRYLYLGSAGWALSIATLASVDGEHGVVRRRLALALVTAVAIGSVMAVLVRQQAWREAAVVRDEVLDNTARVAADSGCATVTVTALPDHVRGAFVFRNGFPEAVRQRMPDVRVVSSGVECVFEWTPAGLLRASPRP